MANKTLLAQIKQRSDTAANWTAKNPIISDGELIIVTTNAGEKRFKVGDGEKTFTQLPYADENILSKIKTYTAGDGISISDTGVISSTGGGSGSDVFVIEIDESNNIITPFDDIKNAIQNHRCLMLCVNVEPELIIILVNGRYINNFTEGPYESINLTYRLEDSYGVFNLFRAPGATTVEQSHVRFDMPTASFSNPPASGAAYWNSTNKKWEIKEITGGTTYKAGNGISISNDGTISVTAAKIYSGTSNAPSADLGENGDIYIQTEG